MSTQSLPADAAPLVPFSDSDVAVQRDLGPGVRGLPGLGIDPPRVTEGGGVWRLEARVGRGRDGRALLFLEADAPLAPSIEALLSAFAPVAGILGRPLQATGPVDLDFANRMDTLAAAHAAWYGWPLPSPALEAPSLLERSAPPALGRALFFTCGVDSFFSLARRRHELDALVHVHGFDVALDDPDGAAAMRARVDAVAAALGLRAVGVRTDLRSHGLFGSLEWYRMNVPALAAIGHALQGGFGHVLFASASAAPPLTLPPGADALYGSSSMRLVTDGYPTRRFDKVQAIAGWELVHAHLQVCWKRSPGSGNCGFCEKCLRTSVMFAALGALRHVRTLPQDGLEARIAALGPLPPASVTQWAPVAQASSDPGLRTVIEDLLARSETAGGWRSVARRLVPPAVQRAVRHRRLLRAVRGAWSEAGLDRPG